MKRVCLVIWLIFLASIPAAAQTEGEGKHKVFAPEWEEFSVLDSAAFSSFNYENGSGFYYDKKSEAKLASRSYSDRAKGTYYFIFSDPLTNPYQRDKVFEFIKFSAAAAGGSDSRVGARRAERFKFADADGFYHTVLAVKTRERSYVFQTVSEKEIDPEAERFLESVRLHALKIPRFGRPKSTTGRGSGFASGSVSCGAGGGDVIVPLRILSKPQPVYNDFARIYRVYGTIELRITFLASGELGEITPLSKLPFGLTRNTIEAARAIRFSPPTRNGVPYTETRVEDYLLKPD